MGETIYNKLLKLMPDLHTKPEYRKSEVSGYMDLNFDRLSVTGHVMTFALSHYYKHPSGDMIPDPDIVMTVDLQNHTVEPVAYQDALVYQEVYTDGQRNDRLRDSLLEFINLWLSNCIEQGHALS